MPKPQKVPQKSPQKGPKDGQKHTWIEVWYIIPLPRISKAKKGRGAQKAGEGGSKKGKGVRCFEILKYSGQFFIEKLDFWSQKTHTISASLRSASKNAYCWLWLRNPDF